MDHIVDGPLGCERSCIMWYFPGHPDLGIKERGEDWKCPTICCVLFSESGPIYHCLANSLFMMSLKIALYWSMDGLLGGMKVCVKGGICAWKPYVSPSMRLGYLNIKLAHERKSCHAGTLYGITATSALRHFWALCELLPHLEHACFALLWGQEHSCSFCQLWHKMSPFGLTRCSSGVHLAYAGDMFQRYLIMQLVTSWGWCPRHAGHADLLWGPSWNEWVWVGFMSEEVHSGGFSDQLNPWNRGGGDLKQELQQWLHV